MRQLILNVLAAIGALAMLSYLLRALITAWEARRLENEEDRIRSAVRRAHDRGETSIFTFTQRAALIAHDEWLRTWYDEACRDVDYPGHPMEDIEFEQWRERMMRGQEMEAWRAYFAKKERQGAR